MDAEEKINEKFKIKLYMIFIGRQRTVQFGWSGLKVESQAMATVKTWTNEHRHCIQTTNNRKEEEERKRNKTITKYLLKKIDVQSGID